MKSFADRKFTGYVRSTDEICQFSIMIWNCTPDMHSMPLHFKRNFSKIHSGRVFNLNKMCVFFLMITAMNVKVI